MNELIPNRDNTNKLTVNIINLLHSLNSLEYEIVLLSAKNISVDKIVNILWDDLYDEDAILSDKSLNGKDKKKAVREFLKREDVSEYVNFLRKESNSRTYRKTQLEVIVFEYQTELIRKIKKGELENMSVTQLMNFGDKALKALQMEEDRNKEDVKDGIQLIKEYYELAKIKPTISSEDGFNIYDVEFFGEELANRENYIKPNEVRESIIDIAKKNKDKTGDLDG